MSRYLYTRMMLTRATLSRQNVASVNIAGPCETEETGHGKYWKFLPAKPARRPVGRDRYRFRHRRIGLCRAGPKPRVGSFEAGPGGSIQKDVKNEGRTDYVYEKTFTSDKVSCDVHGFIHANAPPTRSRSAAPRTLPRFGYRQNRELRGREVLPTAQHCWFNIDRAAHTPPLRLSTVLGEEMIQFANFENCKS